MKYFVMLCISTAKMRMLVSWLADQLVLQHMNHYLVMLTSVFLHPFFN